MPPDAVQLLDLGPSRRAALDPILERRRVAGNCGGEALVGSERDCDRRDADDDPGCLSGCARMRAHDLHPRPEPLTADRDGEHRNRGANRVRTCDEDDPECDFAARGQRRHRREHGASAGYEHEAHTQSDEEAVRVLADAPTGQEEERTLEQPGDTLREEARGQDEERNDCERRAADPPEARGR